MSDIGSLATFTTGSNLVADLNSNFSAIKTAFNTYAVQTNKSATISVTHTFTAKQTIQISGGSASTSYSSGLEVLSAYSGGGSTSNYGTYLELKVSAAATGTYAGTYSFCQATHTSGTISHVYGVLGQAYAAGSGGTTTDVAGLLAATAFLSGSVVTNAYGVLVQNGSPNGTITNCYGVYVGAQTGFTNATNNYGLYLGAMTGGATVNYQIYSAGTAMSYFAGGLTSASATGGIGYAAGAGGAVTQITSRTTGVELNKVSGSITLFSAAGSATPASFTVTNSTVAATDTIRVVQKSGTDKYIIAVTAVGTGSFEITSYTTGGTTTEQPVFNFTVFKGVAA